VRRCGNPTIATNAANSACGLTLDALSAVHLTFSKLRRRNGRRRRFRAMNSSREHNRLGLELSLQRPTDEEVKRIPRSRDDEGRILYPEVDADGDHVHFEMVPMGGDSLLWLTIRRGLTPKLAASSLRKIADLIDRHGQELLNLLEGNEGSLSSTGDVVPGPLRLDYDENGDLIVPR
jgi:hypothetical protein